MPMSPSLSAFGDLGLGDALTRQREDETEEEKRRKRLGLSQMSQGSPSVQQLLGMGGPNFNIGGLR
jgi:hypothetical protein